eukprot:55183-Eustigmatos_ZCMA.PRE.1
MRLYSTEHVIRIPSRWVIGGRSAAAAYADGAVYNGYMISLRMFLLLSKKSVKGVKSSRAVSDSWRKAGDALNAKEYATFVVSGRPS